MRYRLLDAALATGAIPDPLLRAGSRHSARLRERREFQGGRAGQDARRHELLQRMRTGPIAEAPEKANQQHYELPSRFFELFLGPRRKYSACLWTPQVSGLAQAEEAMLALTCERAQMQDGMQILDLGCGWGSLSIWLAERYPNARITSVSNSHAQRRLIEAERDQRRLANLTVLTADVNTFHPAQRFDRVISVEMFEHMRNWRELLRRIAGWLDDDGRLFVHVFSHRNLAYAFRGTWAAERFFTAGLMPSHDLLPHFQEHLLLEDAWTLPGTHYAYTLQAWLYRLDANSRRALAVLQESGMNRSQARAMLAQWRLFLISTRQMWGARHGKAWQVSHYRLRPRGRIGTNPDVRLTYSA